MSFNQKKHLYFTNRFLLAALALLLAGASGCYQRTIAPELTYDQANVEILDMEIKKMDWEL